MTIDQWIILGIIFIAVVLFITEWVTADLVGLIIIVLIMITGILSPVDAVLGFSNEATLTIMAMFALSGALLKTGQLNDIGIFLSKTLQKNKMMGILQMMIFVGVLSAFINNTPVVAVFIPIVIAAGKRAKISATKLLIPLSFAAILGGLCTLVGTSSNILVSSIAEEYNLEPIGMFEMSPIGSVFFIVGIVFLLVAGSKLIPDREPDESLIDKYQKNDYLTDVLLLDSSKSVNLRLEKSPLVLEYKIEVIGIRSNPGEFIIPESHTILKKRDILRVRCSIEQIKLIQQRAGVKIVQEQYEQDHELNSGQYVLVEAIITPNSSLEGKTLAKTRFKSRFNAIVLAMRSRKSILHSNLKRTALRSGDILLLRMKKETLLEYKGGRNFNIHPFMIISEYLDELPVKRKDAVLVYLIIAMVILLPAFNVLPILVSSILGSCLLVILKLLSMQEMYRAIDWKVIFLIAGTISLGHAMQKTGTSGLIAEQLLSIFGTWGPVVVISALYLVTSILTELISNSASAVLLTPIAISTAESMGLPARPFIMVIIFAASASFMTPIGYQTNTMIFGAGNYKFIDFFRVGAPLNLLFWILATFLIPWYYGL
jgi:di/tricarboxylate transporter